MEASDQKLKTHDLRRNLKDKLRELDWQKLKYIIMLTFAIPEELENKLWQNMCQYDILDENESITDHSDGCSDSISFAFYYLLGDSWMQSIHFPERVDFTSEEQELLKAYHRYLRTKFTFESYWKHLCTMLPEMNSHDERVQSISRIWTDKQ